jgi:hypothetical protein
MFSVVHWNELHCRSVVHLCSRFSRPPLRVPQHSLQIALDRIYFTFSDSTLHICVLILRLFTDPHFIFSDACIITFIRTSRFAYPHGLCVCTSEME